MLSLAFLSRFFSLTSPTRCISFLLHSVSAFYTFSVTQHVSKETSVLSSITHVSFSVVLSVFSVCTTIEHRDLTFGPKEGDGDRKWYHCG